MPLCFYASRTLFTSGGREAIICIEQRGSQIQPKISNNIVRSESLYCINERTMYKIHWDVVSSCLESFISSVSLWRKLQTRYWLRGYNMASLYWLLKCPRFHMGNRSAQHVFNAMKFALACVQNTALLIRVNMRTEILSGYTKVSLMTSCAFSFLCKW